MDATKTNDEREPIYSSADGRDPILYRSTDGLVMLVDLPGLLCHGVWPSTLAQRPHAISIAPREEPFDTPGPEAPPDPEDQVLGLVRQGLVEISEHVRSWCLPRFTRIDMDTPDINIAWHDHLSALTKFGTQVSTIVLESEKNAFSLPEIYNRCVVNDRAGCVELLLDGSRCYIPPESVFLLGKIPESLPSLRETINELLKIPYFDFVLLDPPWPNRSARRKGDYKEDNSIGKLLRSIPIRHITAYGGLVGIWITNKPRYRALCLDLFKVWGLVLQEEWIWAKITATGEPITPIDSSWRKPWEILLLARRPQPGRPVVAVEPARRVAVAVPDFHSRKPCLKHLIEPYLPTKYQAIELFARHVTVGWWAVGNEPLRFNREDWWTWESGSPERTLAS